MKTEPAVIGVVLVNVLTLTTALASDALSLASRATTVKL